MSLSHGTVNVKMGECEAFCTTSDIKKVTERYRGMWFCDECWQKEQETVKANMTPEMQQNRVNALNSVANVSLETARQINNTIEVRSDLFNASTVAILEIKKTIDENPEITNKPFALASELKAQFEHHKNVIFELNEKIVDAGNKQKAIQVYLNQMANQLRAEEREQLKIADINYTPKPPRLIKSVTTSQTKKSTKLDKVALRKYAAELTLELGQPVPEFLIQQYVVAKNLTVEDAAKAVRDFVLNARKSN